MWRWTTATRPPKPFGGRAVSTASLHSRNLKHNRRDDDAPFGNKRSDGVLSSRAGCASRQPRLALRTLRCAPRTERRWKDYIFQGACWPRAERNRRSHFRWPRKSWRGYGHCLPAAAQRDRLGFSNHSERHGRDGPLYAYWQLG